MKFPHFCQFQTTASDARQAALEFCEAVYQADLELVIFFCSSNYDLDSLAQEMHRLFDGIQVVGCTTAGEIGPDGYQASGLSGIGFRKGGCQAVTGVISNLQQFSAAEGYAFSQSLIQELESRAPEAKIESCFALMLIDGLSVREEIVSYALQAGLGRIPLIGGSAGDEQDFSQTHVYHNGRFYPDSAVVAIVSTSLPFKVFRNQHVFSMNTRLVVTEADTSRRNVRELDGWPAAEAYAEAIGVSVNELTQDVFAANPIVVKMGGQEYVRSVQAVNNDGSLTFYCAMDEGVVLRIAKCSELLNNLTSLSAGVRREIGQPQATILFDCIHRFLEVEEKGIQQEVGNIHHDLNAVGFCTYGEQKNGLHLNQTLTGIAIGSE